MKPTRWILAISLPAIFACTPPPAPSAPVSTPTSTSATPDASAKHPLLAEWTGPYAGVPPWDQVDNTGAFPVAFDEAIALWLAEIDAIGDDPSAPTFENTIGALERSGKPLDRVANLFFTLTGSRNTPAVQKLSGEIRPKLSKAEDKVHFNKKLFERVAAVHAARATLDAQQKRLVEKSSIADLKGLFGRSVRKPRR